MKKIILLALIAVLLISVTNCNKKGGQYAKEKKTLEELIKMTDEFTDELHMTGNRIAIGRTIGGFIVDIKKMKTELWALEKVCPEYKTTYGYKNAPQELQALVKKYGESLERMKVIAEGKLAKFGGNADVRNIFKELNEVLFYY